MHSLSAHPFTIGSLPSVRSNEESQLVFYLRHQGGFTARLYQYGLEHPGASLSVLVDGPYGGINLPKYNDSDQVLVIVGGSGAGWCLPFIEKFVRYGLTSVDEEHGQIVPTDTKKIVDGDGYGGRRCARPLSLRVILATRDISSRMWFLQTVAKVLSKHSAICSSSNVQIQVYLSGKAEQEVNNSGKIKEDSAGSIESASTTDKIDIPEEGNEATAPAEEFMGRPQLPVIIAEEAAKATQVGQSLGVFVCGPSTMQHDVRNAVAEENLRILKGSKIGGVYLHSEHFSWA
jgi:hypothetical protein